MGIRSKLCAKTSILHVYSSNRIRLKSEIKMGNHQSRKDTPRPRCTYPMKRVEDTILQVTPVAPPRGILKNRNPDFDQIVDSQGHPLKCGDIVRCQSLAVLKTYNPLQQEFFLEKIANQRCVIVKTNDSVRKLTLLNIFKPEGQRRFGKVVGNVSHSSCSFEIGASQVQLCDKKRIQIGSFVKMKDNIRGVRNFPQEVVENTGVVKHIFGTGKVRVQYANHIEYDLLPDNLISSLESKIETRDILDNWITVNSPVRIINNRNEIISRQSANNLPHDATYLQGKFVSVKSIKLIPYVYDEDVEVVSEGKVYTLNLKLMVKITQTEDSYGEEMIVGDIVELVTCDKQIESLQTSEFGGFLQEILTKKGKAALILEFNVSTRLPVTSLRVKIQYPEGDIFTVNPKALKKFYPLEKDADELDTSIKSLDKYTEEASFTKCYDLWANPSVEVANIGKMNSEPPITQLSILVNDKLVLIPKNELKLYNKLGEGKFGTVYAGLWKGGDCAIKKIKPEFNINRKIRSVLKEAEIQLSLTHVNIVQLYGVNLDNDIWMVMQLVHGVDLHRRLWKVAEELPMKSLLRIAKQLADVTSFIHEKGYLHGDIKSSNVMVDSFTGNAIICDFGTAKFLGDENGHASKCYTATLSGTMCYLAPECLERNEELKQYRKPTFKSDVWSLGATFLEMFTKRTLSEYYESVTSYKMGGNKAFLQIHWRELPPEIKLIIAAALRMLPEDRPTSAQINSALLRKLPQ